MNLADMLCYADIHELSRIAQTYKCECNGHSKNELIQTILSAINRRDIFERQMTELTEEDVRFLNSLLFDSRNSFSMEELLARASMSKWQQEDGQKANSRDMIVKFKRNGWLFNGYLQQTKSLFQLPDDLKRRFDDVLTVQFRKSVQELEEAPGVYRDEQQLLLGDILHFLRYVLEQDIPLSTEGFMYKRHLQQIMERLSIAEEPVAKTAWRFGYGRRYREYPIRLSFIYDYCFYHGLIAETGDSLTITDLGRSRLATGQKEPLTEIYRFWLRLYKGPISNIRSIVYWLDKLASRWVTVESLGGVLYKLIRPYYYDSSESILEARILQMMMHIGLIRIGEDETHGKVVQVSKLGSSVIAGSYTEEEAIDLKIDKW
ncbi:hypothetical protein [Paenibacillus sp. MBLB4367]|uniref:hypothetical protein n=1 Tax=Paenibacillus sp. MBLB4367 TaxID=3384767 RepID=UPI0039081D10